MRAHPIIAALLAFTSCAKPEPQPANQTEASDQAGLTKGVDRSQKGKPAPDAVFNDPDGGEISLAEFAGNPVLVNLWATWCAPCIKELPTLDRLAADRRLDGRLGVIAVSQDSGPQVSVDAFLDKLKVQELGPFHDPKMALSGALGVQVMPTTILFDAEGREVWRYIGDLDWTSEEASRLLAEASPGTP